MRILVSTLFFLAFLAPARADEMLRWKLKKGQTLRYRTTTRYNQAHEGGPIPDEANELQFIEDLTLRVKNVDDAGIAEIEVTLDRARRKTNLRGVKSEYDSAQEKDEAARPDAAAKGPLGLGVPILVKMDPRGELHEITWPKEVFEGFEKNGTLPLHGNDRNRINITSLVHSEPVVLPEKQVALGESWTLTIRRDHPTSLDVGVDYLTVYRYKESRDGLALIATDKKKVLRGALGADTQCFGLIHFDPVAGILRDVETRETNVRVRKRKDGSVETSSSVIHIRSELIEGNDDEKKPGAERR